MNTQYVDENALAHRKLKGETLALRQFAGADASEQAVSLLNALIAAYALDLVHVAPDGLIRIQSALQQAQLLRAILLGEALDTPRI